MVWQALQFVCGVLTYRCQRGRWTQTTTRTHDELEQWLARLWVIVEREDIASHTSIRSQLAVYLLTTRPCGFTRRALAPRLSAIFLQFIGTIHVGSVSRGVETRADGEIIDRSPGCHQGFHRLFIEVAADHDAHLREPSGVQNASNFAGEVRQITAVKPHSL